MRSKRASQADLQKIRCRLSTLSHVRLESPFHIKECQFARAAARFLGRPDAGDVIVHDDAFEDWPDERVSQFDIDLRSYWEHPGALEQRSQIAQGLDTIRERMRNSISYKQQCAIEFNAVRKDFMRDRLMRLTADVTEPEFQDFVASDDFAKIPIVDLEVTLLTKLMKSHAGRTIKPGDATDVDAMAAYLPYCDAYATDKLIRSVAMSLDVEKRHGCKVFDAGTECVQRFIEFLEERLR